MSDDEFLQAFEACRISRDDWTHRAHVRVAYLYALRNDLPTAIHRVRSGIKKLNKATDTPEAIDRGYHETITVAFMQLIAAAIRQSGAELCSERFCDAHPELMTKQVLRKHYSPAQLMTYTAKTRFVSPDLAPLPLLHEFPRLPPTDQHALQSVRRLADALDAEDYLTARTMLADDCIYELRGSTMQGADRIIASYREHGDEGRSRFDAIAYRSSVAGRGRRTATIEYVDVVTCGGKSQTHYCLQDVTTDDADRVIHIQHVDLPGQREALQTFIQACC